jgi:acetylglutamate kinase
LPAAAETVLTFLESVGRRSEAELYLRLFRKLPRESFALIAVGGPVVRDVAGSLAEQLRFLADLGLVAPVVLGLLDSETAAAPHVGRLLKRLNVAGLDAVVHDAEEANLPDALRNELRAERIPIVVCGATSTLDERLARVRNVARALDTRKLVFLRRRGGLGGPVERPIELGPGHVLEVAHGTIDVINLRTDRQPLLIGKKLKKDDVEVLERVRTLLEPDSDSAEPAGFIVSVASPLNLLRELFTVKGAGTLIKYGSTIESFTSYAGLDLERLAALIESSFGRPLAPGFFDWPPLAVYVEAAYRGALVLQSAPLATFLSKFAVEPVARGEGIGQDLWHAMVRQHPALYWRSRPDNPIGVFYQRVCDGMQRLPDWSVFWRGVASEAVPRLIDDAVSRPSDFQ